VWSRDEVFTILASHLNDERRFRLLEQALEATLAWKAWIGGGNWWPWNLKKLASLLTDELLEDALKSLLAVKDKRSEVEYSWALGILAPYLPAGLLKLALQDALTVKYGAKYPLALAVLAHHVGGEQRTQMLEYALNGAQKVKNDWEKMPVLVILAPLLTGKELDRAMKIAWPLDGTERALALAALAQQFSGEHRTAILERALEGNWPDPNDWDSAWQRDDLENVLQLLFSDKPSAEILELGLKAMGAFQEKEWRELVVVILMPRLTKEQSIEVQRRWLAKVLNDRDENRRIRELIILAPLLQGEVREQILAIAEAEEDEWNRVLLLAALLPDTTNDSAMVRNIRRGIINILISFQERSREDLFRYFFRKELFAPSILSSETLAAIASQMIEICDEWCWL